MTTPWPRVRELFESALDRPAEGRTAFVRQRAAGDSALEREVLDLLANEAGLELGGAVSGFLRSPVEAVANPDSPTPRFRPGDRIGTYTLVRELDSGGMGTVFEAAQERPARTVALKVLRRGLHSLDAVRRFELESEVLGRLQHPGIAAVFEAGVHRTTSEPGATPGIEVPWFALEFVDGARDLVRYADDEQLGLRERLGLFLEVAAAVHHAHQKGVIHRDLKPGNVLVTPAGQPKVIDYGVARLTDGYTAGETGSPARPETISGGALGTLPYMSPEQLTGDRDGIDVRTDVYGLGAILFELLTGRTPHATGGVPLAEAVRAICDEPPPLVSSLPRHLPEALSPELDWISLRALAKDRNRRYGTAAELADDVLRFLRQEPVRAGPPTATYRLKKLYVRHRVALTAAALALLALVAGLVGTSVGLVRARAAEESAEAARTEAERERELALAARSEAEREREAALAARSAEEAQRLRAEAEGARARAMLEFLGDSLAAADPARAGAEVRLVDYLRRAGEELERRFADEPDLRRTLDRVVGRAFSELGEHDRAERHLARALDTLEAETRPGSSGRAAGEALAAERVDLMVDLAVVRAHQLARVEALELLERAEAQLSEQALTDGRAWWRARAARCLIRQLGGERDGLEEELRDVLDGLARTAEPGDRQRGRLALSLASFLQEERRFGDAQEVLEESLGPVLERWGEDEPLALLLRANLAMARAMQGRRALAIEALEGVLPRMREVLGREHYEVIPTMNNLAALYYFEGRHEDAIELWSESLEVMGAQLPDDHPTVQGVRSNLGTMLLKLGRADEAEPILRESLAVRARTLGEGHERTLAVRMELARLARDHGHADEALTLYEEGHFLAERHLDPDANLLRWYEIELGTLLMDRERLEEGFELLQRAQRAIDEGRAEEMNAADREQVRATLAKLERRLAADG